MLGRFFALALLFGELSLLFLSLSDGELFFRLGLGFLLRLVLLLLGHQFLEQHLRLLVYFFLVLAVRFGLLIDSLLIRRRVFIFI